MTSEDTYRTITESAEAIFKDKSSKFLTYAYPVESEAKIKEHLDALRKRYYDATHHCYAWRIGPKGEHSRSNDDGEPSGTAGKPILGQMLSMDVTNILIVVVRYFGGTKLGVAGLINAYRESAKEVLEASNIVEKTVDVCFKMRFSYLSMNDVMKIVKEMSPRIVSQNFDNLCQMQLAIRQSEADRLYDKLKKCEGVEIEEGGIR